MVTKKKTGSRKTTSKSAASRRKRGRKALTPVTFSPSSKGSGLSKTQLEDKPKARGTVEVTPGFKPATVISLEGGQGELRDIGELTFGRRKAANAVPGVGVAKPKTANNIADRKRVPDVRESPWRKICDLLITAADGTLHSGTAWFISTRTLVTAGHCLSVFKPGIPAHGLVRSVLVMPARNGENSAAQSPFGWVEVSQQNLQVHPNWANNGNINFDYGAIILPADAPLGAQTGFFGYGHFLDQDLDESAPTLSGYPDNVPDGTQWFENNLIKQVTQTRIFYDIFTFPGQSGSPLFFRNDNRQIACGIHTFGDVPLNSGVRINTQVIAQLNAWKI